MKKIAFVFSHVPHGTSFGREGLDAILGISMIITQIHVFFIGDGVFQLIKSQNPESILARNYASAFSILSLYNIKHLYCCQSSLKERGLHDKMRFILKVKILKSEILRTYLHHCDGIINF